MRTYDPEVQDAIWQAFAPLIPERPETHPYGGHRRRADDRRCFDVMVIRLASGVAWVDAARLAGGHVSDSTVRARRDEWIAVGIFDWLESEALASFDRIGWKWSIAVDGHGVVVGVAIDGANRNDCMLLEPTLDDLACHGLTADVETIHLDAGYDSAAVRSLLAAVGIGDAVIAHRRRPGEPKPAKRPGLGLRWVVERTNSWLSNFGQLRRNNDRRCAHRRAHLGLALVFLVTAKLIDWRDRYNLANPCPA